MRYPSKITVLTVSFGFLLACQLQAGKPTRKPKSNPHTIQFVAHGEATCPVATSQGFTVVPGPLWGTGLDYDRDADFFDFNFLELDSGNALWTCAVTVHSKKGNVSGVTLFFGTAVPTGDPDNPWEGGGLHRTDQLPASASVSEDGVWTIHVDADCVAVWKEKGAGKGTVAGYISVDNIVYAPVNP